MSEHLGVEFMEKDEVQGGGATLSIRVVNNGSKAIRFCLGPAKALVPKEGSSTAFMVTHPTCQQRPSTLRPGESRAFEQKFSAELIPESPPVKLQTQILNPLRCGKWGCEGLSLETEISQKP